ncbi:MULTISPECIES: hypothetical protein [Bacillus cereus group]|uniref:YopX protein domain-containing protein n=2 Tax=Bacillus cytotoxicus TaxID=580165 RepID=A0AAX2CJ84_9BACI|nr:MULTISPECIES: hypothetical protein [Bacillus cereus group]MDH2858894.1 hypothetical protein [Bacillus cytotoxicus]MDH2863654.1 hypothetical protein [Bacillus cytotoxicus]MDH2866763.1 hypothetical protein [Bacillus cytotoxicus]MDH2871377.1 hypothetical protein [Bacillus cytotoxicus]MDH2874882.1 hypothetical protein [Bacillus cytotoxicus]
MQHGDLYMHYKQKEYFFSCIALPFNEFEGRASELEDGGIAFDAHTPEGQEINKVQMFYHKGVTFIDKDKPHVIYQSEDDYNTENVWAREVENFFGMVNVTPRKTVRRFIKIKK